MLEQYPVSDWYDAVADREGHVPYTEVFFAGLGTLLSRKIHALYRIPYKVLVLDCDNTLWKGVAGEDGPQGIGLSEPFLALQRFVVDRAGEGMVVCLCSKNVEEDVGAIFDTCDDMVLKRDHLVSWRINWEPKSVNIKSLAREFDLGLDCFIFLDDNPVEIAEVRANCPDVLTVRIPEREDEIPLCINNIWAFDQLKVTEADKKRSAFYQRNVKRKQLEKKSCY